MNGWKVYIWMLTDDQEKYQKFCTRCSFCIEIVNESHCKLVIGKAKTIAYDYKT
jgi:hypothetical protein